MKKYSIKQSKDSFKIYLGGKLLWKVKIYDDKIKISNNNENSLPWQIKVKDGKAKLYDSDEVEKGRIHFDKGTVSVRNSEKKLLYTLKAEKLQAALGVFLISEIPLDQKIIIYSELRNMKK